MIPRHVGRALAIFLVVLPLAGCGGGDTTKQEFLDHAVKFATAAKTPEQKANIREVFSCIWPEVRKDEELLSKFMDADKPNDDITAKMSKLMVPCITKNAVPTTAVPTTAPATTTTELTVGTVPGTTAP